MGAPAAARAARRAWPRRPARAPVPERRLVGRDAHLPRARPRPVRPQAHVVGDRLDRPPYPRPRAARGLHRGRPAAPRRATLGTVPRSCRGRDGRRDPHAGPVGRAHRLGPAGPRAAARGRDPRPDSRRDRAPPRPPVARPARKRARSRLAVVPGPRADRDLLAPLSAALPRGWPGGRRPVPRRLGRVRPARAAGRSRPPGRAVSRPGATAARTGVAAGDRPPRGPQAGQRRAAGRWPGRAHRLAADDPRPGRGRARVVPRRERRAARRGARCDPRALPRGPHPGRERAAHDRACRLAAGAGRAARDRHSSASSGTPTRPAAQPRSSATGTPRRTWRSWSACSSAAGARASTPRPG